MTTGALDPLIHDPERLRIVATLAALPDGDALFVTRLQDMLGLTPGSQITRLREPDHARLDATLTATSHVEPSQAARDLPDLRVLSTRVSIPREKRAMPGHRPGPAPGHGAWPHRRGRTRSGSS